MTPKQPNCESVGYRKQGISSYFNKILFSCYLWSALQCSLDMLEGVCAVAGTQLQAVDNPDLGGNPALHALMVADLAVLGKQKTSS